MLALGFLDVLLENSGSIVTILLASGGTWCHKTMIVSRNSHPCNVYASLVGLAKGEG
jgi:hypothetical protein